MKFVAKFTVQEVNEDIWEGTDRVRLQPEYDPSVPEDERFSQYTPTGRMMLDITNPNLKGKFKKGQQFYLNFESID